MKRFLVVYERTATGYSAYAPDLPGCIATGSSRQETEQSMAVALEMHLAGLREDGVVVDDGESFAEVMVVPAA